MDGGGDAIPAWIGEAEAWRRRRQWTAADLVQLAIPGLPTSERRMRAFLARRCGEANAQRARGGRAGIVLTWHRDTMPAELRQAIARKIEGALLRFGIGAATTPAPEATRTARQLDRLPPKLAQRAVARAVRVAEGAIATFPSLRAGHLRDILRAECPDIALPTLRSVQRWLSSWKRRESLLYAQIDNPDRARSRLLPAFGSAVVGAINARWEIDATPSDLLLADGRRYTLLGLIDVGTRRLRLLVAPHSSGVAVGLLLRRCLLEFGIPGTVATDNGAEFVGQHIRRVFSDLRIIHDIAPPFSPDRKPFIERAFRTFAHDLVELMPGFVGHNVAERAAIRARRSFADRLCGRSSRSEVAMTVTAEDLQAFCDAWAKDRYERRVHGRLDGKSPFQAAQAQAQAVVRIADERALDALLAPAAGGDGMRVVTKKGIRIDSGSFIAPELALLIGKRVECRADPADAGRIAVYHEGRFACIAVDPERTGIDRRALAVAARRLQAAELSRRREALRAAKRQLDPASVVQAILAGDAAAAAKVVALPPPAPEMFTTPALEEAGLAARADAAPTPPPRSEADAARERHLVDLTARMQARRQATSEQAEREEAEARIRRGMKCRDAIAAGVALTREEILWFDAYEDSSEFRYALVSRRGIDIRPDRYRKLSRLARCSEDAAAAAAAPETTLNPSAMEG